MTGEDEARDENEEARSRASEPAQPAAPTTEDPVADEHEVSEDQLAMEPDVGSTG